MPSSGAFAASSRSIAVSRSMPRRSRRENRHRSDQDTVGMLRDERKEQEELSGKKKAAMSQAKAKRILELEGKKSDIDTHPPRIARPGKPLIR